MPDRKYQIFISSTFKDLREYRKAIIDQILMSGNIPSGMESFVAGNDQDLQVIQKAIYQCDIYVVIIGSKYGSTLTKSDGSQTSYTKIEFEYARTMGKPILAFLLEEEQFKQERDEIPSESDERSNEAELRKFREEVKYIQSEKRRLVGFFGDKHEGIGGLRANFQSALHKLISSRDFNMPGWMRGDECERTKLPEVIDKNQFIRDIVENLSLFDTLSLRCTEKNPDLKETISEYFWYRYLPKIIDLKIYNLFFGSGSTIVFLSNNFSKKLTKHSSHYYRLHCKLITNNILTYLHFVLCTNVDISLEPYGPPEPKYGATFGEITRLPECPPADDEFYCKLSAGAKEVVGRIAKDLFSNDNKSLFLVTASGIVLDDGFDFQGPHVGSYYNKIFKRSILHDNTNRPVVLFLDEQKFDEPFIIEKCHSVCDEELKWRDVCEKTPLAICFGCRSKSKRDDLIEKLKTLGLSEVDPLIEWKGHFPAIVKNSLFQEHFKL